MIGSLIISCVLIIMDNLTLVLCLLLMFNFIIVSHICVINDAIRFNIYPMVYTIYSVHMLDILLNSRHIINVIQPLVKSQNFSDSWSKVGLFVKEFS